MSKKQMNNEAGFMGLEGMGALLFYLVMLAGAALLIAQLFSGGKLTDMEKGLSSLRMNIQQLYTEQGNYAAIDNKTVIAAGIVPSGFKVDATAATITSPWNTTITVAPTEADAASGAVADASFTITVEKVPADDCVKLAMYELDAWNSITVDAEEMIGTSGVADATKACEGAPAKFVFTAN